MSSQKATISVKSPEYYRLPTNVKPIHYDLIIHTNLKTSKFVGSVTVLLEIVEVTSSIVFHTLNLNIANASLRVVRPGQNVSVYDGHTLKVHLDTELERGTIDLPVILDAGCTAELTLDFGADLTGALIGYFRSAWRHEGKTEYYSLTSMAPTNARRAFPCWDEPLFKATFSITMISRKDTVALSNMNIDSEGPYTSADKNTPDLFKSLSNISLSESGAFSESEWKITRFAKSPPMSTYLVAFSNGPFAYVESSYTSPLSGKVKPLRVYATPDLIHQAHFVLGVTETVMPRYEQIFDIEYPLPKLDTLAAADFDSGAMENWGLIIGRLNTNLLDPKNADALARRDVTSIQTHEIAHQWFGNITTMAWWDNIYLNEGFATLMGSYIIPDKVFPDLKMKSYMVSVELKRAFDLDAKLSSHPIDVPIDDPKMIHQVFDMLAYSKAASVLRMLLHYLGEDNFLKGVSIYLKSRLFKNGVTEDLWAGITEVTGIDVASIMDTWIKKTGFPVVTVIESEDGIFLRQDRFLESGKPDKENNETTWSIPLSLLTISGDGVARVDNTIVLDTREKFIPLDTSKSYKLNAGTVSFYRVLYPGERLVNIAKLATQDAPSFTPEDRIGLLSDALALAKAGMIETSRALDIIQIFRNETEFYVTTSLADTLNAILDTWWENQEVVDLMNGLRRDIFGPMVKRLGYEASKDEPLDVKQLRIGVITAAADANEESVVKELTSRFAKYVKTGDDSHIPPDLLRPTYITAARHGGPIEWQTLKSIISNPTITPSKRSSAIFGICSFTSPSLINQTFDFALKEGKFDFMRECFDEVVRNLGETYAFPYILQFSFQGLNTKKDYEEIKHFFKTKDTSAYRLSLNQILDGILSKAAWKDRSTEDITKWLKERSFVACD
ncbi:Aminopeptidase [Abortiporus biennis]